MCRNRVGHAADNAHLHACPDVVALPLGTHRDNGARVIRAIALMPAPVIVAAVGLVLAAVTLRTIALVRNKSRNAQPRCEKH